MAETQRTYIKKPSKNPQTSSAHPQRTGQFLNINSPAENVMQLQRTLGNQAVQGLFASGRMQARLKIGQPNDMYEQEADRVADQVMSMPEPVVRQKPTWGGSGFSSRDNEPEDDSIKTKSKVTNITPLVRRQTEEEPEEELQTRAIPKSSSLIRPQQEMDEEEDVQASPFVRRQDADEEEVQAKTLINRQEPDEEEIQPRSLLQRQESEEEEILQTKKNRPGAVILKQNQNAENEKEGEIQTTVNGELSGTVQNQYESDEEEETLQSKNNSGNSSDIPPETASKIESQKGGGHPLSDSTRAFFEPRFGADFSIVRVHTDHNADQSAKSINALAYTLGNDIVFSKGRYSPDTESGKRLLGHELTHVIQQKGQKKIFNDQPSLIANTPVQKSVGRKRILTQVSEDSVKGSKTHLLVYWSVDMKKRQTFIILRASANLNDIAGYLFGNPAAAVELAAANKIKSDTQLNAGVRLRVTGIKGWKPTKNAIAHFMAAPKIPIEVSNPAAWLAGMGVASPEEFVVKKKDLDKKLQKDFEFIIDKLDEKHYSDSDEGQVISILRRWGQEKLTTRPKRYANGGEYLDKLFMKLKGKTKDVGGLFTTQRLSYYSIIFNEFDRVNEVAAIRDTYSWLFRKDSGVKMVTYGGVFVDEAFAKALSLAGVPREKVMNFLERAGDKLSKIFKHPGQFLRNLINAVSQGFTQFKNKIGHYLEKGLLEWIFGNVSGGRVDMPKDFSPQSILKLVLQVLGFTREYIRKKVAKVIGEKNVERIERVWQLISYTMKEGLGGLWKKLKEFVGDLKEKIISAVKNWLIFELVTTAVAFVAKLFTPISGLVAIIKMIYNVIKFLIEKARQLKELFQAIVTSLSEIVEGKITRAADKVEEVLGRLLSLAISFLAGLLNIRIVKGVRMAIKRIKDPIDAAITKLINKVAAGLKKAGLKVKKGARALKTKIIEWWKTRVKFSTSDGETHQLFFRGKRDAAKLTISSRTAKEINAYFSQRRRELKDPKKVQALSDAVRIYILINETRNKLSSKRKLKDREKRKLAGDLQKLLKKLAGKIKIIGFKGVPSQMLPTIIDYTEKEGKAGKVTADPLTIRPGNFRGSSPSRSIKLKGWELIERIPNYENYYVKLHILSEKLHGPGNKTWNLTPGGKSENSLMEKRAEAPAFNQIKDGEVLWYESEVTGYRKELGYRNFATAIKVRWGLKKKTKDGKWIREKAKFDKPPFEVKKPGLSQISKK